MNDHTFYLAYGADMDPELMISVCPDSKVIGAAALRDHGLKERKYADIDPEAGSTVYGVLYRVSRSGLEKLAGRNGCPSIRKPVKVQVECNGAIYHALTYEMTPVRKKDCDGIPFSPAYRGRCSAGAELHNVPNEFSTVNIIVYGTLMTGERNHGFCKHALRITPCTILGTLYDTRRGFPAFAPVGDTRVQAELIQIPLEDWPGLDALEGYPARYERKFTVAELPNGSTAGGWVYIANSLPARSEVIESGSWKQRRNPQ